MQFFKYIVIFILILTTSINSSYAQDSNTTNKSSKKVKEKKPKKEKKEKKPKKEKKEKKPKKEKKEKKPKKVKEEKQAKEKKASETDSSSEGEDKNFGPVFNGASISASAGVNIYFGDIADYNLFPKLSEFGEKSNSAFKFSIARDIKWGLGAKFNYQSGKLQGTRQTGRNSTKLSFENSFFAISLQPQYLISDILFKKDETRRFKIYAQIGIGYMWYRTKLYDTKTLNTKDYEGYIEVEETEAFAQKVLSDKTSKATTLTIPYGVTVVYKLNHKIDLHLDFTQSSTTTDRLDAFSRDWTAKDKYEYVGIGLTYNFNRTSDDAPKKRSKKDGIKTFEDDSLNNSGSTPSMLSKPRTKKKGLFGKKKKSEDDELLNIRLKLFETQLKLFEMQYLLGK
jgi:hypothetical protein